MLCHHTVSSVLALLKSGLMQIFLAPSISPSCTDETVTCTKFSFTWDLTSSLRPLIPAPCEGMARVLQRFPSSSPAFSVASYLSTLLIPEVLGSRSGLSNSSEAACSKVVPWHLILFREQEEKIWGLAWPQIEPCTPRHYTGSQLAGFTEAVLRTLLSLIWGTLWLSTDEVTSNLKMVPPSSR